MNFGRQSRGSMRSSLICGNRKSGGPSRPAARLPGPPRSISQYHSAKIRKFVSQISTPETISPRPFGDVVVQQVVRERAEREDVRGAHERGQRRARCAAGAGARPRATLGVTTNMPTSSTPSSDGHQPGGPGRQPLGQQQLHADRREHRQLRRPERLAVGRRRIGAPGRGGDRSRPRLAERRRGRPSRGSSRAAPAERLGASLSRMGIENPVHLLFIAVVALVVLGPKRLPALARALGQGIREFRQSLDIGAGGEEHSPPPAASAASAPSASSETPAPAPPPDASDATAAAPAPAESVQTHPAD